MNYETFWIFYFNKLSRWRCHIAYYFLHINTYKDRVYSRHETSTPRCMYSWKESSISKSYQIESVKVHLFTIRTQTLFQIGKHVLMMIHPKYYHLPSLNIIFFLHKLYIVTIFINLRHLCRKYSRELIYENDRL